VAGGSIGAQISDERGRRKPPMLVSENYSDALSCGIKISAVHCLVFITKHACDRQTDRITTVNTALA